MMRRSLRHGFDDGVHPPPNAEGRVKEVLCIGGAYVLLITLAVAFSGKKKKAVEGVPSHGAGSGDDVLTMESLDFGEWIGKPGNAEKHKHFGVWSLSLLLI